MAVFKCKMCGGTIEFKEGATVGTCDSCGTRQTLPRLDDDRKANLYDRANHFRRNNEFDKAMGIYEQILNEDDADAEAYWSLVLCRYGIEYVEDPSTHRRVPTVNRTQYTSIFADEDYKSAISHADGYQKAIYEEEAKAIDGIQKGILEISSKEEPFDVFICYKETDERGKRTRDSVLANDLYHQLTQEGFKVFFSRITLEDKLGSAYEPYIFAALNSAKVMVVLGTRPEHFNAVWVKNEWSRYLALIRGGAKKMLIPAYRDMDPYDLPEEFSHLQAQDMSKLGFMQDIIRGIKKIVNADRQEAAKGTAAVSGGNAGAAPLLKRAFMFLEDGNFAEADEYCEKVLDMDPENAEAYLGKLMAEYSVRREEDLKNCKEPFDGNGNYEKALRFADEDLAGRLKGYIGYIEDRNENERLEGIYLDAANIMEDAKTENAYKSAARKFETIKGYKDADELAGICYEKAEICRKDSIYDYAKSEMDCYDIMHFENAIDRFETIPGWKDADEQIDICKKKIEELEKEEEASRKKKKIAKKIAIVSASVAAVVIIALAVTNNLVKSNNYEKAVSLYEAGKYEEAGKIFDNLEGYKDSKGRYADSTRMYRQEKDYEEAVSLYEAGKYGEAGEIFNKLKGYGYKDSMERYEDSMNEKDYEKAVSLYEAGKYGGAAREFKKLEGYKDSMERYEDSMRRCEEYRQEKDYEKAVSLYEAGKYGEAGRIFNNLEGYKDSMRGYEDSMRMMKAKIKKASVGDTVIFGSYDNKDIKWIVLAKKKGRSLLLSKYALSRHSYDDKTGIWETCSLRNWLNNAFSNEAFTLEENSWILTTYIPTAYNKKYGTDSGNATQDRVFLLSYDEVKAYCDDKLWRCKPTPAMRVRADLDEDAVVKWWTRTPGDSLKSIMTIQPKHRTPDDGNAVYVRPALWVSTK